MVTTKWWTIRTLSLLLVVVPAITACTGSITFGDPSVELARLELVPDELGGLQIQDCIDRYGTRRCSVLPNLHGCVHLEVSVRGNASTVGRCVLEEGGQRTVKTIRSVAEGVPILCRINTVRGCVQCGDTNDRIVLDRCGGANRYTTGFDDARPSTDPPPAAKVPGPQATDPCGAASATRFFEDRVNALLRSEGINFSYRSTQQGGGDPLAAGSGKWYSDLDRICRAKTMLVKVGCDHRAKQEGFCYCWSDKQRGPTCRPARIVAKALEAACSGVPTGCEDAAWASPLYREQKAAIRWLMQGSYPLGSADSGGSPDSSGGGGSGDNGAPSWKQPPTAGSPPGTGVHRPPFNGIKTPKGLTSQGSPLVLDLAGDGLELTSAAEGVDFDLLGAGRYKTAWTKGADDALLFIDLDGDGGVQQGAELFGEATALGASPRDGFAALALLDGPQLGGNDNGLVERGDLLFGQLRLWADANRDGVSQPDEVRTLAAAGVSALSTRHALCPRSTDSHGNDLSLRGSFIQADGGVGLMVDVFFTSR